MRKNLGVSQKDLARSVGVSQSYIARLEKGEINPAYDKIRKIYAYLERKGQNAESMDIKAERLMSSPVVWAMPNDSVLTCLSTMRKSGFSQLPVGGRGNSNMGTVTESGINDLLVSGTPIESLKGMNLRSIMSEPLPVVGKNSPLYALYPLLRFFGAVLISDSGEIVGIITKADILKAVEAYG
ncbi:MAG: CBS domain-containing protein [Candidatus Thermoplasmatota archaeon]|nr:CBS domain-containing protein [Candidatus Thermoplasmatota archaeon]